MRTFCSLCELAILCMQRIHVLIVIDLDFIYWFQTVFVSFSWHGWNGLNFWENIYSSNQKEAFILMGYCVLWTSDCLPQVPALVKKALNHLITYFHVMWQNECIINWFSNLHCMWHILSFLTYVDDPWSPVSQAVGYIYMYINLSM